MKIIDYTTNLITHSTKSYSTRQLRDITNIVIHHTASISQDPRIYAYHHVNINNWPAIGYHYLISRSGDIYQVNKLTTVSYHCKGKNLQSIGISFMDHLSIYHPTIEAEKSLSDIIELLQNTLGGLILCTHRQFSKTECPGNNFSL